MIVDLHLQDKIVVIIGAGKEGIRKMKTVQSQGARIIVYSKEKNEQITNLMRKEKFEFIEMQLKDGKFLRKIKPHIVITTTNDKELNDRIISESRNMNCYAYSSDSPKSSDFSFLSVFNIQDEIDVAVSTKGSSPIISKKIKNDAKKAFQDLIKNEDILNIKLQRIMRERAKKTLKTQKERKEFLDRIQHDKQIQLLIKDEKLKNARIRAMALLKGIK